MSNAMAGVNTGAVWRKHGPFSPPGTRAILRGCPVRPETLRLPFPSSLKHCSAILGRSPAGRQKHDLSTWTVIDNWPERVPVTEAEVEVFERWFADLFDELFGSAL